MADAGNTADEGNQAIDPLRFLFADTEASNQASTSGGNRPMHPLPFGPLHSFIINNQASNSTSASTGVPPAHPFGPLHSFIVNNRASNSTSASTGVPPVHPFGPLHSFIVNNQASNSTSASTSVRPVHPFGPLHSFIINNQASNSTSASTGVRPMQRELLKACSTGDVNLFRHLILHDPDILFSATPHGNTCLHIAVMLSHGKLAEVLWSSAPSLFSHTNKDGETPLVAGIMAAKAQLASDILTAASRHLQPDMEGGRPLNDMLLIFDKCRNNALHHAIRNGFEDMALELLNLEPRLSEQANFIGESPMHMAARRGYCTVVQRLLQIPSSADSGPKGNSALHAAVKAGHTG